MPLWLWFGFGEGSMGMTAGKGSEGDGDIDLLEEKDDRRLWLTTLGGFIGNATDCGVPGCEGTGEPMKTLGVSPVTACER